MGFRELWWISFEEEDEEERNATFLVGWEFVKLLRA